MVDIEALCDKYDISVVKDGVPHNGDLPVDEGFHVETDVLNYEGEELTVDIGFDFEGDVKLSTGTQYPKGLDDINKVLAAVYVFRQLNYETLKKKSEK